LKDWKLAERQLADWQSADRQFDGQRLADNRWQITAAADKNSDMRRWTAGGRPHQGPSRPQVHLRQLHAMIRRDYLRTALTYMLISMPHGTSTIFGAFQAIFGAPCKTGRNSALSTKVTSQQKFASEIFSFKPQRVPAAVRKCTAMPAGVHMQN
jgi:hypothetical protein